MIRWKQGAGKPETPARRAESPFAPRPFAGARPSPPVSESPFAPRPFAEARPSPPVSRSAGHVLQRKDHTLVGTMLHHAPQALGDTTIDDVNKNYYNSQAVLDSRRGALREPNEGTFDWDFQGLAAKIVTMRQGTGLPPGQFPVVVNANWMVSPGHEEKPIEYMDKPKGVYAVSSVWGFNYKDADGGVGSDYPEVLESWKKARDQSQEDRAKRGSTSGGKPLGEEAQKLLRTHAADTVEKSRNDTIPHRGLRNYFFTEEGYLGEILDSLEEGADYMHIVTLDSDAKFQDASVLQEIATSAEKGMKDGVQITATDYVYDRADLFEWFAGALDKIGRSKLESDPETPYDAYPAEPGLTISYDVANKKAARELLASQPFGPEFPGKPTKANFKQLVESRQSVEGKNLRESWRQKIGDPTARINRTAGYVSVDESDAQASGHPGTLEAIEDTVKRQEDIPAKLIQTLITADTYHSLTPDRNSETKKALQSKIVADATKILNQCLKDNPGKQVAELKAIIYQALVTYMRS